jgi:hypothetical protein
MAGRRHVLALELLLFRLAEHFRAALRCPGGLLVRVSPSHWFLRVVVPIGSVSSDNKDSAARISHPPSMYIDVLCLHFCARI